MGNLTEKKSGILRLEEDELAESGISFSTGRHARSLMEKGG